MSNSLNDLIFTKSHLFSDDCTKIIVWDETSGKGKGLLPRAWWVIYWTFDGQSFFGLSTKVSKQVKATVSYNRMLSYVAAGLV